MVLTTKLAKKQPIVTTVIIKHVTGKNAGNSAVKENSNEEKNACSTNNKQQV